MNTIKFSLVGAAVVVALFGCNSDSNTITTTTPVTLSVSDAPIDDVSEVVITYSKVAFLPLDGGSPQIFEVYKTDEEGNYVDENGDPIPDGEDPLPLSVNLLTIKAVMSRAG
ncbi:putative lipoprotein [Vibrio parahaemolyticus AN-5034]|nr:putative lipoprotein [Vibrio parahaemolyticus AN-5034]